MSCADFRPFTFLLSITIAIVLFGSFQWVEETRALWDIADRTVFYALNGTLQHNMVWAYFWAVANNSLFDLLSTLFMVWLVYRYAMEGGEEELNRRIAHFLYMVIIIVLAVAVLDRLLNINHERHSPTAVLPNVFMLGDIATWFEAKDFSYNSYPSDHAIILSTFTLLIWHFAGKQKGRLMLAAAVFFCLPRLIGGGHWLTDMVCGSVPLALTTYAVAVYTPLKGFIIHWLHRFTNLPLISAGIRLFFHPEMPLLLGKGMGMGSADVVPGVSGGTVAYITNVWDRLMDAIKSVDMAWLKLILTGKWTEALKNPHLAFVVPLIIGIAAAFITFSKFIPLPVLMQVHPEPVYGMFFGLLVGSIILLILELGKLSLVDCLCLVAGIGAGWLIVTLVPMETPNSLWFIFLCGCIAICALLLPGVSGAFILLIMGKYTYMLDALAKLDLMVILPFLMGCITGLFTFARVASWLVTHYYRLSTTTVTGILIGSLWVIWPFQQREYLEVNGKERLISSAPMLPETLTADGVVALGLGVTGFLVVVWLGVVAARKAQAIKTR